MLRFEAQLTTKGTIGATKSRQTEIFSFLLVLVAVLRDAQPDTEKRSTPSSGSHFLTQCTMPGTRLINFSFLMVTGAKGTSVEII